MTISSTLRRVSLGVVLILVAAAPASAQIVINEVLADPDAMNGDANGDGTVNTSQDEFLELVNTGATAVDISGFTIEDGFGLRHTFPASTTLTAGQALVVFGGGTPTGAFGGAQTFTASTGLLGFNNGGDTVALLDDTGGPVAAYTYGGEGGNNVALARAPDLTGAFVAHSTIAGNPVLFSPGVQNADGEPFAAPATITVAPTTLTVLEAGTGTFDVTLSRSPTAEVRINVSSSATDEATTSTSQLTFNAGTNTLTQTVTVNGVDDGFGDGNQTATITLAAANSADDGFDDVDPDDVTVNITDNPNNSGPVVTTTSDLEVDDVDCSLREAISTANANPPNDDCALGRYISFNIPTDDLGYNAGTAVNGSADDDGPESGVWTISLLTSLPAITSRRTIIDGFTQPGANPGSAFVGQDISRLPFEGTDAVLRVEITPAVVAATGIAAQGTSGSLFIRGLVLNGFTGGAAIDISSSNATVEGNFIGVEPDGISAAPNLTGVLIRNGSFSTVGPLNRGLENARRAGGSSFVPNVISANGTGIQTDNGGSVVEISLNIIGLGADGETSLGNGTAVLANTGTTAHVFPGNAIDENSEGIVLDGGNGGFDNVEITLSNATPQSVDYAVTGLPVFGSNAQFAVEVFTNDPDGVIDQGQKVSALAVCQPPNSESSCSGTVTFSGPNQASRAAVPEEGDFLTATVSNGGRLVSLTGDNGPLASLASTQADASASRPASGRSGFQTSEFSDPVRVNDGDENDDTLTVQFAIVQQAVREDAGSVDLVLEVEDVPETPTDVTVTLTSGDPADLDGFTSATITIGGPDDDGDDQGRYVVSVPIFDDARPESSETFVFSLSVEDGDDSDGPGLEVGDRAQTALIVVDNDGDAVTVTVPGGDGGTNLFAMPVNGLTALEVAQAAGVDQVFVLSGTEFVPAQDDDILMVGQAILVDTDADVVLSGSAGTGNTTYSTAGSGGRVLVTVGNPTGRPVALKDLEVDGGTLADVALVYDAATGAFRPISLEGLDNDCDGLTGNKLQCAALGDFEVVVFQVTPSGDASGVSVMLPTGTAAAADRARIGDEEFTPTDGETAIVLALRPTATSGATNALPADAPGDVFALRVGVGTTGLDAFDGADVVSPLGATLSGVGLVDPAAVWAALSVGEVTRAQSVTIPLAVTVLEAGSYEIALTSMPGQIGDRPVIVEVFDGTTPMVVTEGSPVSFEATASDVGTLITGRFSVRVSLGVGVANEDASLETVALEVFPNPATGPVTVSLSALEAGPVRVVVYDALGREVAVLHDGPATGEIRASLEAGQLVPGAYVIRATGEGFAETRAFTVAR